MDNCDIAAGKLLLYKKCVIIICTVYTEASQEDKLENKRDVTR